MKAQGLAIFAHEVNRAYCWLSGDATQPAWADAPAWQRESALAGVEAILEGRVRTPADSHESWLAQKLAEGWAYGETKDPEKKLHPCVLPYAELPETQRIKDELFLGAVLLGARALGLEVAAPCGGDEPAPAAPKGEVAGGPESE